jgi:hypothetical protein
MFGIHFRQIFQACFILFSLASCKKPDTELPSQNRLPPNIKVSTIAEFVGSGIDSLPLVSGPLYDYAFNEAPFSPSYQIRWACIEKPQDAPDPLIIDQQQKKAQAMGLVEGEYVFEVTYSTIAGSKKASLPITVIPDIPSGKVVLRNDLTWDVDETALFPGQESAWATWDNDPVHIFFRGMSRLPKVEYLNPLTKEWVVLSTSLVNYEFNQPAGTAQFDYPNNTIYLKVRDGVTWDWQNQNHSVRLTF